jgi:dihydroneopterin aldolase
MTDRIIVDRIGVFAYHGVADEEQRIGQRFHISLEARVDCRRAGASDDVADTVSYADLADIAVRVAEGRRFRLIEALAEKIAADILTAHAAVQSILVRVDKPSAPVPHLIDGVAVVIERSRHD